jgi:pimeloyl-ACP methyl ester carboxylesterase
MRKLMLMKNTSFSLFSFLSLLLLNLGIIIASCVTTIGQTPNKPSAWAANSPRLPLKPCDSPAYGSDTLCGKYEVYENRNSRTGRKIALNVVVLPALSANPAPDPLFTFAGGPGQAETEDAKDNAQRFADIRRERDIVMIDQRGTGLSNPLDCSFGGANELVQAFLAGDLPIEKVKECRRALERKADLKLYTTPLAVDDINDVRAWLGYDRINLYGGSYGSRAALVYLRRHPQRVRTVTIRAVFPTTLKNPLYSPRDGQQSLDKLFDDCAADEACAKAFPTIKQDLQTVLKRLAQSPAKIKTIDPRTKEPVGITVTRDVFAGGLRRLLYHPNSQRLVPTFIASALAKDYKPFESVVAQTVGIEQVLSMGLFLSVTCAEDVPLIRRKDIARETAGTFVGSTMIQGLVNGCKAWKRGELPADYNTHVRSDAPVLIFSGALDPQTPPTYGNEVARHLPNSLHVVMNGIAHSPFPSCAIGIMSQFISTGNVKNLNVSCINKLSRPAFIVPAVKK